jgi:hypothetical protein
MLLLKVSCLYVSTINLDGINLKTIAKQAVRQRWKTIAICCRFLSLLKVVEKWGYLLGARHPTIFRAEMALGAENDAQKTEEEHLMGPNKDDRKGYIVSN